MPLFEKQQNNAYDNFLTASHAVDIVLNRGENPLFVTGMQGPSGSTKTRLVVLGPAGERREGQEWERAGQGGREEGARGSRGREAGGSPAFTNIAVAPIAGSVTKCWSSVHALVQGSLCENYQSQYHKCFYISFNCT